MKAYKGFDKNLRCRGFQYEVGKEYKTDRAEVCECGFHACQAPLDVFDYYGPADSRYCEVEQDGHIVADGNKQASTKLKVVAEIGIAGLVKAHIEWIKEATINKVKDLVDRVIGSSGNSAQIGSSGDAAKIGSSGYAAQIGSSGNSAQIGSSGYAAQIGSSGDAAKIGSSGYAAKIGSSGDAAQIKCTGKDAVVACAGINATVCAPLGAWVCLPEYKYIAGKYKCVDMRAFKIDGKQYPADKYLILKDGKVVVVE